MADDAMNDNDRRRPGPLRWIGYALGTGLPERHDTWVLFDCTSRTWGWRHFARAMTQLSIPIVAVLFLIPGPASIRVVMIVAGTFMGLIWSFGYMNETIDHRLTKAGYPAGLGEKLRSDRAIALQHEQSAARRARIVARQARRGW
jgi:hypothetical protein